MIIFLILHLKKKKKEKKTCKINSTVEYGQISMGWPGLYVYTHILSVCVCVYNIMHTFVYMFVHAYIITG